MTPPVKLMDLTEALEKVPEECGMWLDWAEANKITVDQTPGRAGP